MFCHYIFIFREEVRVMFHHAYDSYLKFAYPYDELRPISCDGTDTYGRLLSLGSYVKLKSIFFVFDL